MGKPDCGQLTPQRELDPDQAGRARSSCAAIAVRTGATAAELAEVLGALGLIDSDPGGRKTKYGRRIRPGKLTERNTIR